MSLQLPVEGTILGQCPAMRRKKSRESFKATNSIKETQRLEGNEGVPVQVVYLGIAITSTGKEPGEFVIGITAHDGTYSIDYDGYSHQIQEAADPSAVSSGLEDFVVGKVKNYGVERHYKVLGGAITQEAFQLCRRLPSRLWRALDIVCFVFNPFNDIEHHEATEGIDFKVDEESDSVVRKAIEQFGPNNLPRLMVKSRNAVGVDADDKAHISDLEDYHSTVHANTWKATMRFADSLKDRNTKIAFFNSTPQGGGVALMRHALIRFLRLIDVKCQWYVPRPSREVFRITKNNHNILQGVDKDGNVFDADMAKKLDDWCEQNANRYWTKDGGPLSPRTKGGADVIIVDDPQMPMLVEIAKKHDPDRPVIFRSHIQVRADLADEEGTPTAGVWNWVWNHVNKCDVFVSHPVPDFVPKNVTLKKVGYLPATTDWLDGLNKHMSNWDLQYYMHEFYIDILKLRVERKVKFDFKYPERDYIVQIARFDPAKGIDTVLAAYAELRHKYMQDWETSDAPQLVIAGHGAVDDPDATPIYDRTLRSIRENYADLEEDIVVMRVGPTDQILNALMHNAHVALQLSDREGFEVKVSEALHHGTPIIATNRGGIPLQVDDKHSGFIVNAGDYQTVATYLHHLFTDDKAYTEMSTFAANNVSDEVSTVGNALSWLYLADTLAKGESIEPEKRWINDMAREKADVKYDFSEETILPRNMHLKR